MEKQVFISLYFVVFLTLFISLNAAHASYPGPVIKYAGIWSYHKADASIGTIFVARISGPSPEDMVSFTVILTGPGISGYRVEVFCDPYGIRIIPDAPLTPGSDFTVTLTTGLTDTEGHALASAYEWSFNTGAGDTTPPNITQTVPADGAANTSPWAAIKVYFSENMNPDTINETTVTVYDETAAEYKGIHIQKDWVDEDGNRSYIVIRPVFGEEWTAGHTYTVLISQTVTDLAGNPLGSDYTFNFTVVDHPYFAPDVWVGNCRGVREADGSTVVELELHAWGAHGPDNNTVVATDLTQPGKVWNLANEPGSGRFEYESEGDEGLNVGYHDINFLVTDTINGQSASLMWNFYIFNASPSLTFPLDGAQGVSLTPSLSWNTGGVVNDDLYKIDIYDTPYTDDANVVWSTYIIADGGADYTVTLPACRALAPSTTYYWEVIGHDNHNWPQGDADSELWSFRTSATGATADGDIAPWQERDGSLNIGDAVVALRCSIGALIPTADDIAHGDVAPLQEVTTGIYEPNPDGTLSIGDAVVILRAVVGLVTWEGMAPVQ